MLIYLNNILIYPMLFFAQSSMITNSDEQTVSKSDQI
jgi:hypothetical protein